MFQDSWSMVGAALQHGAEAPAKPNSADGKMEKRGTRLVSRLPPELPVQLYRRGGAVVIWGKGSSCLVGGTSRLTPLLQQVRKLKLRSVEKASVAEFERGDHQEGHERERHVRRSER